MQFTQKFRSQLCEYRRRNKLEEAPTLCYVVLTLSYPSTIEHLSYLIQVHHIWIIEYSFQTVCKNNYKCTCGTPTKRQVTKLSGFKTSGFKTSETSGLQNVRFAKCQVYKMSDLQNVRRLCCSHVCRQSDGSVLFSF
jgi:hypothetical protein